MAQERGNYRIGPSLLVTCRSQARTVERELEIALDTSLSFTTCGKSAFGVVAAVPRSEIESRQ